MKKPSASKRSQAARRTGRGRSGIKRGAAGSNEATTDEFEREDMGIAPKE
jgi:hypothetical protein